MKAAARLKELELEIKQQASELKALTDNYNSERILRKKYYNIIEDMKGKIRVYCRSRPLSGAELARVSVRNIPVPLLQTKTSHITWPGEEKKSISLHATCLGPYIEQLFSGGESR